MKYVIANWKMKMSAPQVLEWVNKFSTTALETKVLIAPSFIHVPLLNDLQSKFPIELIGQDVSEYEKGSHTGEVGAFQLKEFCKFCIVGHSERKESTKTKLKKIEVCLQNEITPIVCFSNPKEIKRLKNRACLFAWEDPTNISKGGNYNEKDPIEIINGVKKIRKLLDIDIPLLYGGSVNRQNINKLVEIEELDGVLVGNASLDPKHFLNLIASYEVHRH